MEVGENVDGGIVPGYYIASCSNGFVSFMIMGEDGENGSMTVTDGVERKITLKEYPGRSDRNHKYRVGRFSLEMLTAR